jgi:hypothetical protein
MSLCVSIVTRLTVCKTHVAVNIDYLPDGKFTLQVTIQVALIT